VGEDRQLRRALTDTSGAVVVQAEDDRPYMAAHGTTTSPYVAIFGGRAS
jgi:hypothetical protein